jgi:hypothetical protein
MTEHLGYEKHDPVGQHRVTRQRENAKDAKGQLRGVGVRDAAVPLSHVRAQDRGQGTDALEGLRRQDPPMYARGMTTRDTGPRGGDVGH